MTIFTMGFTQKNAQQFFELIKSNKIDLLIDIRLNNKSQLAGFTKGPDLAYFLKQLCNCEYSHCVDFAPTKEILDNYKKGTTTWIDYENSFIPLIEKRKIENLFVSQYSHFNNICLLCSEPTPQMCHRRLVADYLKNHIPKVSIKHI